jgi:hypothetical protein
MPDSLSEHVKQHEKERAIKFALKVPAGHLSIKTPLNMAIAMALKNRPEEKKGELDLNNLSPIQLKRTLSSLQPDWVNWLPETLWHEFQCDDITKNKIRAIQTILTTPDITFDIDVFSHILETLNGNIPDWSVLYPLPCEEIVYGYLQLKLINSNFDLWPEVTSYIKACMIEDGIVWLPWLDLIETNGIEFPISQLKMVWDKAKNMDLNINIEDPLHVQIASLQDIAAYLLSMP